MSTILPVIDPVYQSRSRYSAHDYTPKCNKAACWPLGQNRVENSHLLFGNIAVSDYELSWPIWFR